MCFHLYTKKFKTKIPEALSSLCHTINLFIFLRARLLLLNVPVKSYGHVGTVTSDFVGHLPNIEMNDTSSPAFKGSPTTNAGICIKIYL